MQIHVAQEVCEIHAGVVVGKRLHHGETRVCDGKLAPEGPLTRRRLEKALLADRGTTEVLEIEKMHTDTLRHQCIKKAGKGLKTTA